MLLIFSIIDYVCFLGTFGRLKAIEKVRQNSSIATLGPITIAQVNGTYKWMTDLPRDRRKSLMKKAFSERVACKRSHDDEELRHKANKMAKVEHQIETVIFVICYVLNPLLFYKLPLS